MRPGDFLLVRSHGIAAQAIRIADAIGGTWSDYNHAGILDQALTGEWVVIEADPSGVQVSPLSEYPRSDCLVASPPIDAWQARKVVAYARDKVGTPYGWLDIVALGAVQLRHCPRWLEDRARRDDRIVCSQLVAAAYAAAGHPLGTKDPWAATPGYLGQLITEGSL